jgi:hypothetical protein
MEEMMVEGMAAFGSKFDSEPLGQRLARAYRAKSAKSSKQSSDIHRLKTDRTIKI